MTLEGYKARIRLWGLTPSRPGSGNHTIHQGRDGQLISIPDPEVLEPEQRQAILELLSFRYGFTTPN